MNRSTPFFAFFVLVVLFMYIVGTYAVFETDVEVPVEMELADWQIMINGTDVSNGEENFVIDNINWEEDHNVLPGRAAPGLAGYFEIIINPAGTQVGIEYELFFDFGDITNDMIQLESVVNSDDQNLAEIEDYTFLGDISVEDVLDDKFETIRVNLVWIHDEANNDIDSEYILENEPEINIPVSVRVSQLVD